jgi:hypothetical protein
MSWFAGAAGRRTALCGASARLSDACNVGRDIQTGGEFVNDRRSGLLRMNEPDALERHRFGVAGDIAGRRAEEIARDF